MKSQAPIQSSSPTKDISLPIAHVRPQYLHNKNNSMTSNEYLKGLYTSQSVQQLPKKKKQDKITESPSKPSIVVCKEVIQQHQEINPLLSKFLTSTRPEQDSSPAEFQTPSKQRVEPTIIQQVTPSKIINKKSELIVSQKEYQPIHLRVSSELERRQQKINKLKEQQNKELEEKEIALMQDIESKQVHKPGMKHDTKQFESNYKEKVDRWH